MTPAQHIVASTATSTFFYYLTQSWPGTVVCFLSGILIDLDHVLDYWIFKRKISLSFKELDNFCTEDKSGKIFLILHSYELMFILWIVSAYFKWPTEWLGALYGMSVHLLCDQIGNPVYPPAYFLFYRWKIGFPKAVFFRDYFVKEFRRT